MLINLLLDLQNYRKSETSEEKTPSPSPLLGSAVRMGPQGSTELLFDMSRSPLADFHHCERLHQENARQVDKFRVIAFPFYNVLSARSSAILTLHYHHSSPLEIDNLNHVLSCLVV